MIYDCFLFFNEFKILRLRLEELKDVFDQFVLVESTRTFSNSPKPPFFEQNKKAFEQYASKIRHVVVDEMPLNYHSAWDTTRFLAPPSHVLHRDIAALELDHLYYKLNCKNPHFRHAATKDANKGDSFRPNFDRVRGGADTLCLKRSKAILYKRRSR
jgi:hypothetical protein